MESAFNVVQTFPQVPGIIYTVAPYYILWLLRLTLLLPIECQSIMSMEV